MYNIYLISRIHSSSHTHNEAVAKMLVANVFIPHQNNPCDIDHEKLSQAIFQIDLDAMKRSDCGCIAFPVRCDCSAEIGWYHGNGKPVYGVIVDTLAGESCVKQYQQLQGNWMVKGFIHHVFVVGCEQTYKLCTDDPILGNKTTFVNDASELHAYLEGALK